MAGDKKAEWEGLNDIIKKKKKKKNGKPLKEIITLFF